jgi:hypothetical protein
LGGSHAKEFVVVDRFAETGIESEDAKIFGEFAEVVVAKEKHRAKDRARAAGIQE